MMTGSMNFFTLLFLDPSLLWVIGCAHELEGMETLIPKNFVEVALLTAAIPCVVYVRFPMKVWLIAQDRETRFFFRFRRVTMSALKENRNEAQSRWVVCREGRQVEKFFGLRLGTGEKAWVFCNVILLPIERSQDEEVFLKVEGKPVTKLGKRKKIGRQKAGMLS